MSWSQRAGLSTTARVAGLLLLALGTLGAAAAAAADGDEGYVGLSTTGASTDSSGSKPESKLWWNDGHWWGSLWDTVSRDFHIFKLDPSTQTWLDTGVTLDTRPNSRADVLWDGTHLYVASHVYSTSPASGYPSRLYRYSYDPGAGYALDAGFPVSINNYRVETLVIAKDSTGKLWATWVQGKQIYINCTQGSDSSWRTPFVLPVAGTTVSSDDISSIIAFDGSKVGVMWSNHVDASMRFAVHSDGDVDTAWTGEIAAQASKVADDHINLKTDGAGRIFAAVKTSKTSGKDPLINLLVRDVVTGSWSSYTYGTVADAHTRPIVQLDEEHGMIHMFATGPQPPSTSGETGGTVYEKTSPMDSISFAPGWGSLAIRDSASGDMNNATSTKQNGDSMSGLVVLASSNATARYWHHFDSLVPSAPTADFSATPLTGLVPLKVSFTDRSAGHPNSWSWDFGDGSQPGTSQHPIHTYASPGTYAVALTAQNSLGSDRKIVTGYVTASPLGASFAFAPVADAHVSQMYPTTNFGSVSSLRAKYTSTDKYRSYLTFVVSGVTRPVAVAKLRLYVTNPSNDGGDVYLVPGAWDEATITWANAPAISGTRLARAGAVATGTWVELDLASAISGDGAYSFGLQNGSSDGVYYDSREGSHAPQLVVTEFP